MRVYCKNDHGNRVEMVVVELGGKEVTGVTPNAADPSMYAAVNGERTHHSLRAPLVHWHGTVISQGPVLAGVNDIS